jgi:hypothetical protein
MAKSSTQKKSKNKKNIPTVQDIEKFVDQTVDYIKTWQSKELKPLLTKTDTSVPICIPIKNGYVVGNHMIKKMSENLWHLTKSNSEMIYVFSSQSSAISYSLCEQRRRLKLAKEILESDSKIVDCNAKLQHYRVRLASAAKKKDDWQRDFSSIMLATAEVELVEAKYRLQKSLNLTKYFKLWVDQ